MFKNVKMNDMERVIGNEKETKQTTKNIKVVIKKQNRKDSKNTMFIFRLRRALS